MLRSRFQRHQRDLVNAAGCPADGTSWNWGEGDGERKSVILKFVRGERYLSAGKYDISHLLN